MKRVRLRIEPIGLSIHPGYALATGGVDYLSSVDLINWNVSAEPTGQLFQVEGDAAAAGADLDDIEQISDYDIAPIDDERFYLYVQSMSTSVTRELMDAFTRGSLLVIPPVEHRQDGSLAITFVGDSAEIQAAIDTVPDGIETTIEAINDYGPTPEDIVSRLSDQQRAAVTAGIEIGYYNTPRQATHADVAAVLDCSPSTASEHLRKAEATLVRAIFSS